MPGCDDDITFVVCVNIQTPTLKVSATSLTVIQNIIRVAERGPLPHLPFDDINITTEKHLYDLIMGNMSHQEQEMCYFGLTPIHEIPSG